MIGAALSQEGVLPTLSQVKDRDRPLVIGQGFLITVISIIGAFSLPLPLPSLHVNGALRRKANQMSCGKEWDNLQNFLGE